MKKKKLKKVRKKGENVGYKHFLVKNSENLMK